CPNYVFADEHQIEQVIMNLAVNARDAMPRGGSLLLKIENGSLENGSLQLGFEVKGGRYIVLSVADNGVGMDPDTQAPIFEPFFTTKEQGKGTGLGLATVYGIVKQSDGYIAVQSQVGVGTTFKICLPQAEKKDHAPVPAGDAIPGIERGSETILVVD